MSNGEGGLETIQEDQEPDNDQEAIEVCDHVQASCIPCTYMSLCILQFI